jgi:hypothetical protein
MRKPQTKEPRFAGRRRWPGLTATVAAVATGASLFAAAGAEAQRPDFLFRTPVASFSIRGGVAIPTAGSEIFDEVTQRLTLGGSDFVAPALSGELGVRINDRFEALFGVGWSRSSAKSEFREYVDQDDLPIEQTTHLARVPVTAGIRYSLVPTGQSIGRFAWIPSRIVPYIGANAGAMWYRFDQAGDFVDELDDDLPVFTDQLFSDGWSAMGQAIGGVDFTVGRRTALNIDARYTFASADMSRDFVDFDAIDLSGFQTTLGISWRF